ncbi:MAG: hypothetical protein ACK41T_11790 [Pseudobdellovibrio sp.]
MKHPWSILIDLVYNKHMGRYLIIEQEERSLELIKESLLSIDPDAKFLIFKNLKEIEDQNAKLREEEVSAFWLFDLFILDYSLYTHPMWQDKILFLQNHNIKKSAIFLTGYETNFTVSKYLRQLDIYNFIFKPFDQLILKESLNLGLNIRKKVSPLEIKSQGTSAFIAFLKEIELQSISEIGFVTLSDSQIKIGSTTKYFSSLFSRGKKRSVWAQCLLSIPHPQKPGAFINKCQFYGVDQTFLNSLRRHIQDNKAHQTSSALWDFTAPKSHKKIKLALLGLDTPENQALCEDIKKRFKNLQAEVVKIDPQKKSTGPQFDHDIVLNLSEIQFENFSGYFKKEALFLLVSGPLKDEESLKDLSLNYKDIFSTPFDRSYFLKKLKIHCHDLEEREPSLITNITSHEKMKAANKVKISDLCELYVNLIYNRELPLNDFREVVFLSEDETQTVELPAICHYAEKSQSSDPKSGPSYLHQYVFFGMTDHLLKQIRLWLLQNYIAQNQKE